MSCTRPVRGYRSASVNKKTGKRAIVFSPKSGLLDQPLQISCGQCISCRLERSRQWAMRIMHEVRMHKESSFLTLTYSDQHLPKNQSLDKRELQLFMKKLRKKFSDRRLRYYAVGEYGGSTQRPHYHVCLFGLAFFESRKFWKTTSAGSRLYVDESLNSAWSCGHGYIGELNFDSAAYVARYCVDKLKTNDEEVKNAHYNGRAPEFSLQSRRPGLGRLYLDRYGSDILATGTVVCNGQEMPPPRFYDSVLSAAFPERAAELARIRSERAARRYPNESPLENAVRLRREELCTKLKIDRLKRSSL